MSKTVVTTIESIGPATAKVYLDNASQNRKVSDKVVYRYASAMRDGAWLLTHQGIAFDEAGRLCDGQHRMLAVIKSGKTLQFQVTRYKSTTPMSILDSGRARSPGDRIVLAGLVDSMGRDYAAAMNMMHTVERPAQTDVLQTHELAELLSYEKENLAWTLAMFPHNKRQWNAVVRGGFAYCRGFAKEKVEAFGKLVTDQVGYSEGSAAHTFVKALVDGRLLASGSREARVESLSRVIRCIQSHVEGERMPRLVASPASLTWACSQRREIGTLLVDRLDAMNERD